MAAPSVKAIECPNCGGAVEIRGLGNALNAVCIQCLSILDVSHPLVKVVQRFEAAMRHQPKIPFGTRGKFDGKSYEAIGFQVRQITVEGTNYTWDEYVLFNPFHGFRYLSEYDNHWNFIAPLPGVPQLYSGLGTGNLRHNNQQYQHFQKSYASTIFVMGEFPWRVKVNDWVEVNDYVHPPYLLSAETTEGEVTYSHGVYTPASEITKAFALKQSLPSPNSVFANQPNPYGSSAGVWGLAALFTLVMFVGMIVTGFMAPNTVAFQQRYNFTPGTKEASFVTPIFELKGGESNVEVQVDADVSNSWIGLDLALINDETGTAYNFDKEISYYSGTDSDGSWSEGSRDGSIRVGGIPGGKYYLRVEPESDAAGAASIFGSAGINYSIKVIRGVAVIWPYFVAIPFLFLPPLFATIRRQSFETKRWAESDTAGNTASSDDEDDD
jgi:hypothetical protein